MQKSESASGSRLKQHVLKGGDGSVIPMGRWHDATLQADCEAREQNGKHYCFPDFGYAGYFTDEQCTQPAAIRTAKAEKWVRSNDKYFEFGEFVSKQAYRGAPSACGKVPFVATQEATMLKEYEVFSVGKEVPVSTFIELTAAIE